jgi:hypothetical protein
MKYILFFGILFLTNSSAIPPPKDPLFNILANRIDWLILAFTDGLQYPALLRLFIRILFL